MWHNCKIHKSEIHMEIQLSPLFPYGVRPCSAYTFGDQLGLVPGTKSKIEDGSATGTSVTLGAAVADFR